MEIEFQALFFVSSFFVDSFPRRTVLLLSDALFFLFFAAPPLAGSRALFAVVCTLHGAISGATAYDKHPF